MKNIILLLVLSLGLSSAASAGQNGDAAAKRPSKPAVDCSTINNTTLAATVKDKLANTPSLKDFMIGVSAKDGTVTLTGSVKAGRNKGTATLQAKRVACVKKVDNQITVETAPPKSAKNTR